MGLKLLFTTSTFSTLWLHSIPQHQHHGQIRGWYDCGVADHQRRWVCLQEEEQRLTEWCTENNLTLNTKKNKNKQNYSLWTSGRSRMSTHHWTISGERAERVASFKFLSTHISEDLTWTADTTALVKKAQPRLYFLLKKVNLSQQLLGSFYRCSTESILTYGIPAWYGGSSAADKKKSLQKVINTAQNIINQQPTSPDDIFTSCCLQKIHNILKDSFHPGRLLFEQLSSGKRYRSIKTRTTAFINSFYPKAITILSSELNTDPPKHTSTLICNDILSQMHFTVMEHVFCICCQAGTNESMTEENGRWMKALFIVYF